MNFLQPTLVNNEEKELEKEPIVESIGDDDFDDDDFDEDDEDDFKD